MTLLAGEGMGADDAAWLSIAEAAAQALTLPGLSAASFSELQALHGAALRCARQPPQRCQPAWSAQSSPAAR